MDNIDLRRNPEALINGPPPSFSEFHKLFELGYIETIAADPLPTLFAEDTGTGTFSNDITPLIGRIARWGR